MVCSGPIALFYNWFAPLHISEIVCKQNHVPWEGGREGEREAPPFPALPSIPSRPDASRAGGGGRGSAPPNLARILSVLCEFHQNIISSCMLNSVCVCPCYPQISISLMKKNLRFPYAWTPPITISICFFVHCQIGWCQLSCGFYLKSPLFKLERPQYARMFWDPHQSFLAGSPVKSWQKRIFFPRRMLDDYHPSLPPCPWENNASLHHPLMTSASRVKVA